MSAPTGFAHLKPDSPKLYTWTIPTKAGDVRIRLRNGSAGFLLCHMILWLADVIEAILGKVLDDWGYADRTVRGSSTVTSRHAYGLAADINALEHVLGKRGTFGLTNTRRIRLRLKLYRACIRWGGDYVTRADEMHFEIDRDLATCERLARLLMRTPRGRRILRANPTQRSVILS